MTETWLFAGLEADWKLRVRAMARKRACAKGEVLFLEGQPVSAVHLLVKGRVKLTKTEASGKEVILGILPPETVLGVEALFRPERHTMTATALERTLVCVCDRGDFEKVIASHPEVAAKVVAALGRQFSLLAEQTTDLALRDVKGRVAGALLRLGREYGRSAPKGYALGFRLTQQDLADLVGASRVMVSYAIQSLKEAGCLSLERRRLRWLHLEALQQIVDADA
jgi:CRP-like cAMP-binding protein